MAVKTGGGLRTVSWSITEDQYRRIVAIARHRSTSYRRVSQSDVAREVVALGLEAISHERNIVSTASDKSETEAVA